MRREHPRSDEQFMPMQEGEQVTEPLTDEPDVLTRARRALILFVALIYSVLFIDVFLGHYLWVLLFVKKFIFSYSLIPQFFSPIALVVALWAAYRMTPGSVTALRMTMLASILVGVLGTYFHAAPRIDAATDFLAMRTWLGDPPLLAPGAYAIPGIIGLVATYGLAWRTATTTEKSWARKEPDRRSPVGAEALDTAA